MKQMVWKMFVLIYLLYGSHATAQVLFVTSNYEPYVIQQDSEASGIFPDIIKAVFDEINLEVKFEFQPWKRGEHTVVTGKAFATFPYLIRQERTEKFDFSDPVIFFFPKFFYMKERFPNGFAWNTLKDFHPYNMGGILGFWYEKSFQDAGLKVQYVTTDLQNIHKLTRDRIDFTLIDELVGWSLIKEAYPEQVTAFAVAQKPESTDAFHIMVSRNYPNANVLLKKFNEGLKTIKNNGTFHEILQQYDVTIEYATH